MQISHSPHQVWGQIGLSGFSGFWYPSICLFMFGFRDRVGAQIATCTFSW